MAKDALDGLLGMYRLWGIVAIAAFVSFISLLFVVLQGTEPLNLPLLFLALACGFVWIGATSFSRHSFILLKGYIGSRVSVPEFLSTQLVVVLLPFLYRRVKREAESFRRRRLKEERGEGRYSQ